MAVNVLLEPVLDPQANEEVDSSLANLPQSADSIVVQVIVVVMRYAYDIHLGQLVQCARRRAVSLGSKPRERTRSLAEDWVEEHANTPLRARLYRELDKH